MSHICVRAARSALPCLCRGLLILCASIHRTPPRRCSQRRMSSPVTRSSDPHVFFASAWLVWSGWLAPWPRSSRIPISLSALRASVGCSTSICSVSGGRDTCASTSRYGHTRPMKAGTGRLLHDLLVSSGLVTLHAYGERCRLYLVGTLRMIALCNGRHELHSPPQSYHEPKRLVSEMLITISKYWQRRIKNP